MSAINIPSGKTWFTLRFSSNPAAGTVTYTCPEFFNNTGGSLTYTGDTVEGDEIYANENTGTTVREGVLSLTATTNQSVDYEGTTAVTCAWTITQEGAPEPTLALSAPSTIEATATTLPYTATSNVDVVVKCVVDGETQTKYDKVGSFTIPANTTTGSVTYIISASCANYPEVSATTVVTQARAYTFDVQPTMIDFPSGTSSTTLTVVSNTSWTASSNQSWCTLSHDEGGGNAIVTAYTTENDAGARNATITFNVDGVGERTVNVRQEPAPSYNYTFYHYGVLGDDSSCYGAGYELSSGNDSINFNNGLYSYASCSLVGTHGMHDREQDCTLEMGGGYSTAETYTRYSSTVSLNGGVIEFNGNVQTLPDCIGGGGYGGAAWILKIRVYQHGYRRNSQYLISEAYTTYGGSSSSSLELKEQTNLSGTIGPGSYDVEIVLTRSQED